MISFNKLANSDASSASFTEALMDAFKLFLKLYSLPGILVKITERLLLSKMLVANSASSLTEIKFPGLCESKIQLSLTLR